MTLRSSRYYPKVDKTIWTSSPFKELYFSVSFRFPKRPKLKMDPPDEKRSWKQKIYSVLDYFKKLRAWVWAFFVAAFTTEWVFPSLIDYIDRMERYMVPEYEVPPLNPVPTYFEGLAARNREVVRRRTSYTRAERRSRPYELSQSAAQKSDRAIDSASEINVGASTSTQLTAAETELQKASFEFETAPRHKQSLNTPPLSPGQSHLSGGAFWEGNSSSGDLETKIHLSATSQTPPNESLSQRSFTPPPPTDSSTSYSENTTTESSEQSSEGTFNTDKESTKDASSLEPPPLPGTTVDASQSHFSGGAVWEAPTPVSGTPLFSESDFSKITSQQFSGPSGSEGQDNPPLSLRKDLDSNSSHLSGRSFLETKASSARSSSLLSEEDISGLPTSHKLSGASENKKSKVSPGRNIDVSLLPSGSVLEMKPLSRSPPLLPEEFYRSTSQQLPGASTSETSNERASPLSPGTNVGIDTSHFTGGSFVEADAPPVRAPPLFSQEDFAKIMPQQLSGTSSCEKQSQGSPSSSRVIDDSISSHLSGGSVQERVSQSARSRLVSSERAFAGISSPPRTPFLLQVDLGEISRSFGILVQNRGTSTGSGKGNSRARLYASLTDDDEPDNPKRNRLDEERTRPSSMEDIRQESWYPHAAEPRPRRIRSRFKSIPTAEPVSRSTRILRLLDRMDIPATEESLEELRAHGSTERGFSVPISPRRNTLGAAINIPSRTQSKTASSGAERKGEGNNSSRKHSLAKTEKHPDDVEADLSENRERNKSPSRYRPEKIQRKKSGGRQDENSKQSD